MRELFVPSIPSDRAITSRELTREEVLEFIDWLVRNRRLACNAKWVSNYSRAVRRYLEIHGDGEFNILIDRERNPGIALPFKLTWT